MSTLIGVPLYVALNIAIGTLSWVGRLDTFTLLVLVGAGVLHFVVGRLLGYLGLSHIGANRATPLMTTSVFYSVAAGILLLGEELRWEVIAGAVLAVLGVLLISMSLEAGDGKGSSGLKGLLATLGAGVVWGFTPLLMRVGVLGLGHPAPAVLVSYLSATPLALILVGWGRTRQQGRVGRQAGLYLLVWSLLLAAGNLMSYAALAFLPVSIMVPLFSSAPLYTLVFSRIVNPRIEAFSLKVILGAASIILGVFTLSQAL
jgi:drug/metabolite transporter (DMT)-like permease